MSLLKTLPLSKWGVAVVLVFSLFCGDALSSGLSPEEEHRLVMKADASVIDEKLKEMPFGVLMAPAPLDEHSLPMPTMDPPLPEGSKPGVQITTAAGLSGNSKQALSERIRNAMKTMKERMRTLQSSRSRIPKKPVEVPKVPKFPRPSSLITSNPSDLEVAMKRIEIMASRAGFNMSSIPRRSQMQIVSRLAPKLPGKMSAAVKEELETMSGKIYHYLPEPARDPLIEDDQAFLQHFMDQFDQPHTQNDEFYKEVNSHAGTSAPHQKLNSFDVSQVSLTDDPAHEAIQISESAPSSSGYVESSPELHLMPPKFDAGEGQSAPIHTYISQLDDEGVPKPSALISQYPTHHVDESDPLITLSSEIQSKSIIGPTNASRTTKSFQVGSMKAYGHTTSSPAVARHPPTRAPPTIPTAPSPQFLSAEDIGPTVSVPPKPIRVSVITKDSILVNDTSDNGASGSVRTIKYVHVEPLPHSSASPPELSSFDQYLPLESISKEVKINPKEITVNIDKDSLPRFRPSQLVLDTYESPKEIVDVVSSAEPPTEDPYPLTDEEIAATVAELKKYEAEMAGLRQGENSLESDYPYRLLTPHPLEYPDHPDHPQPSSLEDDSDLVSHLDELLAEFNTKPKEPVKTHLTTSGIPSSSSGVQHQATVLPSPASLPMVFRRPHPLLKHRPPHRPGLGRPMMMGSRLRPMIRHPPAGFPRPNNHNQGGNMAGNPPRINEVTVSQLPQKFNKECDYFSDELCLLVQDYPIEAITEAMEQNPSVSNALLSKEPAHNQKSSSYMDGIPETSSENEAAELGHKHPDFAGEGGFLCPSKVAYGKIKKAKSSTSGDWKFIVNYGDKSQTLRLEKCLLPGDSCSYVMPHFRTACTQVYNYHRLLAWDSEKGLHTDVFKVPTCCTCHVLGYYVPGSKKSLPQSSAMPSMRRRDHPGPRFIGPPRPRRIHHMPHHGRKPMHPMMIMLPNNHNNQMMSPVVSPLNVLPPATTAAATVAINTTSAVNSEDDVLRSLLLQYAGLREKITKLKDSKGSLTSVTSSGSASSSYSSSSLQSKRSSKLYSHWPKDIIKALRKRKRQSTISSKNNKMKKPSPEMLKKLKNLLTNSTKLENNPKLKQKIQIYLRKLKNSGKSSTKVGKSLKSSSSSSRSRGSRNMKMKLSSTASTSAKIHKTKKGLSKSDAKKRLMQLLTAAKTRLQDEKRQARLTTTTGVDITTTSKQNRLTQSSAPPPPRHRQLSIPPPQPPRSQTNYESHPIWNYFNKLQNSISSSSNRARRLRRLF